MGPLSRPGEGPPTFHWPHTPQARNWYGTQLAFTAPLEAETRRLLGPGLRVDLGAGWLRYTVRGLRHDGDPFTHTIRVVFEADPWLPTFGLAPEEFPRVYADPGQRSPHRHNDDALCLWQPYDPKALRWTSDKGLHDLLGLSVRHLFAEHWWREHDVWLLPEAPHGGVIARKRSVRKLPNRGRAA